MAISNLVGIILYFVNYGHKDSVQCRVLSEQTTELSSYIQTHSYNVSPTSVPSLYCMVESGALHMPGKCSTVNYVSSSCF